MLRNRKFLYAVAIGFILIVVFVPLPSFTLKSKGTIRGAMAPAERGASSLWRRASETMAVIRGIGGAVEENRDLSQELVRLQVELNALRDAEIDNIRLRRAFKFRALSSRQMIACEVVSRNISGWWQTVRLGKGKLAGIEKNRAVISPDGLVGRTTEATSHTTEVLLVCDPACRVSAKISRANVFGLIRGMGTSMNGQPKARMEFINKDAQIRVGDEVVTSGLSGNEGEFPTGVHIGYIEKVYVDESGLYQYADLIPRATASLLDYVFVLSPSIEETP